MQDGVVLGVVAIVAFTLLMLAGALWLWWDVTKNQK